jgi:PhnB protein
MQLYPHLTFDGRCEEAFGFYEKHLHGKTVFLMRYENTPVDLEAPSDWGNKISHATFALGEFLLFGSDALPGQYRKPEGFLLQFNLSDPLEAERIFQALAGNGTVRQALEQTFWALRFGIVVDPFDIPWMINCEKPA